MVTTYLIIDNNQIYFYYDRRLSITSSFRGIKIVSNSKLKNGIYIPFEVNAKKHARIKEYLSRLITEDIELTFSERVNFNKYVIWALKSLFNVSLVPDKYMQSNHSIINFLIENCGVKHV